MTFCFLFFELHGQSSRDQSLANHCAKIPDGQCCDNIVDMLDKTESLHQNAMVSRYVPDYREVIQPADYAGCRAGCTFHIVRTL